MVDSRKDVDWQLKKTCEEFIHLAVSSLVSPIRHFLEKATYLVGEQKTDDKKSASFASEVSTSTANSKPLRLQPFATPEKVWIVNCKEPSTIKRTFDYLLPCVFDQGCRLSVAE